MEQPRPPGPPGGWQRGRIGVAGEAGVARGQSLFRDPFRELSNL